MGEIVNLRMMKKRRERATEAQAAKESRVRHGRTKAEKANDARELARQAERVAAARPDPNEG